MTHVRDLSIDEISKYKYIGINNHAGHLDNSNNENYVLISPEEQSHVIVLMINYTDKEKAEVAIFKNSESYTVYIHNIYQKGMYESLGYVYSFFVDKNKIAMVE
ncbi:MAG TPA: hypothetical protein V6C58_17275 [Allocoleopsis sp.]